MLIPNPNTTIKASKQLIKGQKAVSQLPLASLSEAQKQLIAAKKKVVRNESAVHKQIVSS